jgi:hypothetical protein
MPEISTTSRDEQKEETDKECMDLRSSISDKANEFTPITTQEELDRIVTARIKRERAKYVDYELLKEKAAMLDKLSHARKEIGSASSKSYASFDIKTDSETAHKAQSASCFRIVVEVSNDKLY